MNEQFHPGSAIVGLVFIALGAFFLLDEFDVVRMRPALILPILLIGLGLGLVVSITDPSRRNHGTE